VAQRTGPVVDFPAQASLDEVVERLRAVLGRLTALFSLTFLENTAGYAVAAAVSTDVNITSTATDLDDAGVDEVRVHVYGGTAGGAGIAVVLWDATNARELCRVALPAGVALYSGNWTAVAPVGGDATVKVRVLGDNVNAQTLHRVRLEGRTTKFT
jgi:hypothetical protein